MGRHGRLMKPFTYRYVNNRLLWVDSCRSYSSRIHLLQLLCCMVRTYATTALVTNCLDCSRQATSQSRPTYLAMSLPVTRALSMARRRPQLKLKDWSSIRQKGQVSCSCEQWNDRSALPHIVRRLRTDPNGI